MTAAINKSALYCIGWFIARNAALFFDLTVESDRQFVGVSLR